MYIHNTRSINIDIGTESDSKLNVQTFGEVENTKVKQKHIGMYDRC